jgi:hypothetical protein
MASSEPFQRWMTSVLDLDPVWRSAAAIDALPTLGNQALQTELAGLPEQVRADRTLSLPMN